MIDPQLDADYQTLTSNAGWIDVGDRTQLEIGGADRAKFLHNLCTNDVKSLAPGAGCEAFFTNVQGKILAHVFLFADDDFIFLDTVPGQAASLLAHLDRYLIREDVRLIDRSSELGQTWLIGPRWRQAIAALTEASELDAVNERPLSHGRVTLAGAPTVLTVAGFGPGGAWLRYSRQHAGAIQQLLRNSAIPQCSGESLEALRIEARFPAYGRDISDRNLPQEVDRDRQAISFRKGCYLGQETVARIDALGHVNRLLRRIQFIGESVPSAGAALMDGEKTVGEVTSAVWSPGLRSPLALAYVRREASQPGQKLQSEFGDAIVVAEVGV